MAAGAPAATTAPPPPVPAARPSPVQKEGRTAVPDVDVGGGSCPLRHTRITHGAARVQQQEQPQHPQPQGGRCP
eukprot:2231637-Pyramimonas_sp.AAC.1